MLISLKKNVLREKKVSKMGGSNFLFALPYL